MSRRTFELASSVVSLAVVFCSTGVAQSSDASAPAVAAAQQLQKNGQFEEAAREWQSVVDEIALPLPQRLHFWIGEWDCYSASSGKINGRNDLVARVGDNVLHEIWKPVGGGPGGESWNFFDPTRKVWRQLWMNPGGPPFEFAGMPKDDGILFEGPQPMSAATLYRKRMFIRPIGQGRVQQTGTQSSDGGKSWQPNFDLVYVPRGQAFDAASQPATAGAPTDPARQFDFLIGEWRMDVEQYDAQGERIRTLTEWSRVRPRIGGASLIDEWVGSGFTVRTWDPKKGVWRLFWTDSNQSAGRMQLWEGTFADGVGTFIGGSSVPDGPDGIFSKIEFSEIADDSVLWKMWKTPDGGESWVLDYVRRYTRVGA